MSPDWLSVVVSTIQGVATVALVWFAAVTINEGRKDRKRATIERM